jgi:hypothetical protein
MEEDCNEKRIVTREAISPYLDGRIAVSVATTDDVIGFILALKQRIRLFCNQQ